METVDLKLVLLGQPGVGKTCLVYRYLYNTFGETISTIGASFAMKKVEANGRACNLGIWDTAGQERFDSLSSFYCRGARAAIICFDLTDRSSFDSIQAKWIKKVADEAENGCHICLVGTKADLVQMQMATRAVSTQEAPPPPVGKGPPSVGGPRPVCPPRRSKGSGRPSAPRVCPGAGRLGPTGRVPTWWPPPPSGVVRSPPASLPAAARRPTRCPLTSLSGPPPGPQRRASGP
eukprot:Transcript_18930.p2 GENE.Transcript_18930~~Transcript_18930.p2  ORF type:complete len:234 (-),score=41.77 Transcript_18930:1207-1908(-)